MASLLDNPLLSMGAAILDPRGTFGSFGAALNKGLLAGAQAQAAGQQMALQKMQLDALQRQQERKQALSDKLRAAGMPQQAEYDQFPGEQPIQGLLNQPDPAQVMQTRMGLLQDYMMENDPSGYMGLLAKSQDPTTGMQNYEYLRSMGVSHNDALSRAFSGGVTVNVGDGGKPLAVGDLSRLRGPGGQELPYGTTDTQAAAMGARVVQQPSEGEAKSMAQSDLSFVLLDDLETLMTGDGAPDTGPSAGMYYDMKLGKLGDLIPGELSENEAKLISITTSLSNQLLAAMRGAQVGPAEQEKFEKQLPVYGQQKNVFMENLRRTRENLKLLENMKRKYRNIDSQQANPPAGFTVPMP